MLQVLLVHKDLPVLETIRNLPIWQGSDFTLVATINDEQEALSFLHSHTLDILLSDSRLVVSLSQGIRESGHPLAILTLDTSEGILEQERLAMALFEARRRFVLEKGLKALEEEKLYRCIKDGGISRTEQTRMFSSENKQIGMALFHAASNCKEILSNLCKESILIETGPKDLLVLFSENFEWKDNPTGYLRYLLAKVGTNATVVWDGYLREPFDLQEKYHRLLKLSQYQPFFCEGCLITGADINQLPAMDLFQFSTELETMRTLAKGGNLTTFIAHLKDLYSCNLPQICDQNPLFHINSQIMGLFLQVVSEGNLNPLELFGTPYVPVEEVFNLSSTFEMCHWFERAFRKAQILLRENEYPVVQNEKVQHALRIMHRHYSSPLTLDTLASECKVHKVYLCRVFSRDVGMPCHEYLQKLRLRKSIPLLFIGKESNKEIALQVGFTSYDQFSKAFHREMGMSPHRYKELHKEDRGNLYRY
ncbi:DNA-binding domain-containing protein, AraC-type [Sphaerochaeta pleomorpha str. Grapes]|uniref:DNA-binding domain-containing protein, AraC-type n=1 Tax=Sphaerochaeta pleomorpha (strain ATCC BAA-1885 / DSM 22778 / Grapes) TaxID=158190 RepID=G8QXJ5_SPHPG|nr:helix-turn-helix domain-containing protein [Sphaerochaeta pleomorpha]AEV29558.1 DNA-binding domain-containing protein, AraC-type [Sphaerochaeta pleomorpha str. Grapes]